MGLILFRMLFSAYVFVLLASLAFPQRSAVAGQERAAGTATPLRVAQNQTRTDVPSPPPAKPRGWIGIEVRSVDAERAREISLPAAAGAEIVALIDYGPGARSGLKPRDVIVSMSGAAVTDHAHLVSLTRARQPGDVVELVIMRSGTRLTVPMTIGDFFNNQWDAAHRGNPVAMRALGFEYYTGNLVAKDLSRAVIWNRKAAAAGDVTAMANLARFYQDGDGVERSDTEAQRWYRRAAEAGHAESMFAVGLFNYRGQGSERNIPEAIRWYKRAIDKGHAGAMQNYAGLLQSGTGVEKNEALAMDYFRRAAKLGQPESFASLGLAYYSGLGVRKDIVQAEHWFREAAKRNVRLGYTGLGMVHEHGHIDLPKDRAAAIGYYRKGAEAGDDYALGRLKALKAPPYDPAEMQKLLSELGFNAGGRKLTPAIRAFQKSRGLSVDGKPSLRLVGQLREALKQQTAARSAEQTRAAVKTDTESATKLDELKGLETLDTPR